MKLTALATILILATVPALSAQDPGRPSWRIHVAEGTPTREYPPVSNSDRTRHIELVEDLVVGGANDPREAALFYGVSGIAVDAVGRIFVAEERGQRVQVFDADGSFLRALGQRGRGPGELHVLQQDARAFTE